MPPTNKNGLVAAWNFDENTGTVAKDLTGKNNLQLTSNQLWTIWQDLSYANIYVNGRQSVLSRLTPTDVGDYNDTQFTVGGTLSSPILKSPYFFIRFFCHWFYHDLIFSQTKCVVKLSVFSIYPSGL